MLRNDYFQSGLAHFQAIEEKQFKHLL